MERLNTPIGLSFDLGDLFLFDMIFNLHSSASGRSECRLERFKMPAPTRVGLVIKEASLVLVLGGMSAYFARRTKVGLSISLRNIHYSVIILFGVKLVY